MTNFVSEIWKWLERIIILVLKKIYKLFGKNFNEKKANVFLQFIRFGIVGLSNTLISYLTYLFVLLFLKQINYFIGFDYIVSQGIAFFIGVIWSFLLNNKFVFGNKENKNLLITFLKVLISYSFTGLFLNSLLLYFWVQILDVSEFIAPIINLLVSVPLNFILNKNWAFKSNV